MWSTQTLLVSYLAWAYGVDAAKTWVSLPVHGPPVLADLVPHKAQADAALGTPPQNTSLAIDIASTALFALTPECVFCPPDGIYEPTYSSSAEVDPVEYGDSTFGGNRGNETVTFGGVLQDLQSPIMFIEHMSTKFSARFTGGHLGLFVPQLNQTRRKQSVLVRMDEQGQLLNPVWGLRMGGEDPRLTIGALDPNDYQGEINWVPAVNDSAMIQVDALRGYQGNALPAEYPLNVWIDSFSKNIYIPDLDSYMLNDSLVGPQDIININPGPPANESFGVYCDGTKKPEVQFSVEINGVDYPVNQTDLIRPHSGMAAAGFCNVGVWKSTEYVLGVTFLRSVYLAYRFPTGNCPGYWGFATPKGSPAPTSTQKPKVTPTDAGTCLSFTKPSSTPTPTIAVNTGLLGSDGGKYGIYGRPDAQWVELRNANELPPLKVTGGTTAFGE